MYMNGALTDTTVSVTDERTNPTFAKETTNAFSVAVVGTVTIITVALPIAIERQPKCEILHSDFDWPKMCNLNRPQLIFHR